MEELIECRLNQINEIEAMEAVYCDKDEFFQTEANRNLLILFKDLIENKEKLNLLLDDNINTNNHNEHKQTNKFIGKGEEEELNNNDHNNFHSAKAKNLFCRGNFSFFLRLPLLQQDHYNHNHNHHDNRDANNKHSNSNSSLYSLDLEITLPIDFPLKNPSIEVDRKSFLFNNFPRQVIDPINNLLTTFTTLHGPSCLNIIQFVKDNLDSFKLKLSECPAINLSLNQNTSANESDSLSSVKKEPVGFDRVMFLFHHIYNKEKKRCIVDEAIGLNLTGCLKSGKPGIVIIEGESKKVKEWTISIRRLSWQKMSAKSQFNKSTVLPKNEHDKFINQLSRFDRFIVISSHNSMKLKAEATSHGQGQGQGQGQGSKMSNLIKLLRPRGLENDLAQILGISLNSLEDKLKDENLNQNDNENESDDNNHGD